MTYAVLATRGRLEVTAERCCPALIHLPHGELTTTKLLSGGGFYVWELEKDGREVNVRVDGQVAFNDVEMIVRAAEAGLGLGFVMEDQVMA